MRFRHSPAFVTLLAATMSLALAAGCSLFAPNDEAVDHQPARAKVHGVQQPSCHNGEQDGDETDVDCGGDECAPCRDGAACDAPTDCASGDCREGTCVAVVCGDGLVRGDELCDGDGEGHGGETETCDLDCTPALCGDGTVNEAAGESCDDGDLDIADDCPDGPGGTCRVATCGDGIVHDRGTGQETGVDCGGSECFACPGELLLSEVAVEGTTAEFIEIHNPSGREVNLSYVFLADFESYYLIGNGTADPGSEGFLVKFPLGASIEAGETLVVSTQSASEFEESYGVAPDFDMAPADIGAPALIGVTGSDSELSDVSGVVVLFTWDGQSSLVSDLDIVLYGNADHAVYKTGVTVGSGTYLPDVDPNGQSFGEAPREGQALIRCDVNEGSEVANGGNGYLDHVETSEDLDETWQLTRYVTPGMANPCLLHGATYGSIGTDALVASAADAAGNVFLGATSSSPTIDMGCGALAQSAAQDGVVAKLTPDGRTCLWATRSTGGSSMSIIGMAVDGAGDVIVAGWYRGDGLSFGGNTLTAAAAADIVVAKLDGTDGSQEWIVAGVGTGWDAARAVAIASDGTNDAFVVGSAGGDSLQLGSTLTNPYPGSRQVIVARLASADGAPVWSDMLPGSAAGSNQARAVAVDGSGDVTVVGYFMSPSINFGGADLTNAGDRDAFVVKLDGGDGHHLWSTAAAGEDTDITEGVAVDGLGNVLITGRFESDSFSWGTPLSNSEPGDGFADTFVTKLSGQSGSHLWSVGSVSPGYDLGLAIATLPDGGLLFTGSFDGANFTMGADGARLVGTGGSDPMLIKLRGTDGSHVFSMSGRGLGTSPSSNDVGTSLAVTPDSTVIWTGQIDAAEMDLDASLTLTNSYPDALDGFLVLVR
ncbi:MAG: lamin tail domain-containing protein [Deltaproteobacteria bacterium]|nr:lamin tail domain-containing protein [Deltaproteobacteria bacterium]MBW2529968.1 lamin tail domain-containing protein [Deltaproteobacteria bacterium]